MYKLPYFKSYANFLLVGFYVKKKEQRTHNIFLKVPLPKNEGCTILN